MRVEHSLVPLQQRSQRAPLLLLSCEDIARRQSLHRKQALTTQHICWCHDLEHPASQTVNHLLFKLLSLWFSVRAAWMDRDRVRIKMLCLGVFISFSSLVSFPKSLKWKCISFVRRKIFFKKKSKWEKLQAIRKRRKSSRRYVGSEVPSFL